MKSWHSNIIVSVYCYCCASPTKLFYFEYFSHFLNLHRRQIIRKIFLQFFLVNNLTTQNLNLIKILDFLFNFSYCKTDFTRIVFPIEWNICKALNKQQTKQSTFNNFANKLLLCLIINNREYASAQTPVIYISHNTHMWNIIIYLLAHALHHVQPTLTADTSSLTGKFYE